MKLKYLKTKTDENLKVLEKTANSLAIKENRALLDEGDVVLDPVKRAVKKFGYHPRKRNVSITTKFSFTEVDVAEMITEINNLK